MSHCHRKLSEEVKVRSSLKFLKPDFLPLGTGPHAILKSCGSSVSCIRAATIQIQILSGKYHTDYKVSKWTDDSGVCSLGKCGFYPGDIQHLLSSLCPVLGPALKENLSRGLPSLEEYPDLYDIVSTAYKEGPEIWCSFVVDPTTHPVMIQYKQLYGISSIYAVLISDSCTTV